MDLAAVSARGGEGSPPHDPAMKKFWNCHHIHGDVDYLTGSGGPGVIETLLLEDLFPDAKEILNIGIGLGRWEKFCKEHGKVIDSLDIVELAGECVKEFIRSLYLFPEDLPENAYDLITELLVAQHVTPDTLERHFKYAIAALRPEGTYAIQIPDLYPKYLGEPTEATLVAMQAGAVCYPIAWVDRAARMNGGQIIEVQHRANFPQHNSMWHVYKIKRMIT